MFRKEIEQFNNQRDADGRHAVIDPEKTFSNTSIRRVGMKQKSQEIADDRRTVIDTQKAFSKASVARAVIEQTLPKT